MKLIQFILGIGIITYSFPLASAVADTPGSLAIAQWEKPGVEFRITRAFLGKTSFELPSNLPSAGSSSFDKVIAVTFEFINKNPQRKIDINSGFSVQLQDEYQNLYRQILAKPIEDNNTVSDDRMPTSLYPDGIYRQTVYFEAPIAKSQNFLLTVNAQNAGFKEPILLNISRAQVRDLTPPTPTRIPQDEDLRLIAPNAGTTVAPGTVVHIGLQFAEDIRRPQSIFIIAPNYTFEDVGKSYRYDVRIPKDQPQGPFEVVVLAHWGQKDDIVLSKTVHLEVVTSDKQGIESDRQKSIN